MRVLIIGGTGLISTAITRDLVARGEEVTLYNRGQRDAAIPDGAVRLYGDRSEYDTFEQQMAGLPRWDCVIDMVAFKPADVESAVQALAGRTAQYLFCSTVDVYTKPARSYPTIEDAEREPRLSFPYALNKARCENILEDAHTRGDLPVTIIRPAHTYSVRAGAWCRPLALRPISWIACVVECRSSSTAMGARSGRRAIGMTSAERSQTPWATPRPSAALTTSPPRSG